jgi:cell division protein ZapA
MTMTDKSISTTIEILGKFYLIRCLESEVSSLQAAAEYLNHQMLTVQKNSVTVAPERIAIITALNIVHQFLEMEQQKGRYIDHINQRIGQLQDRVDHVMHASLERELIYPAD